MCGWCPVGGAASLHSQLNVTVQDALVSSDDGLPDRVSRGDSSLTLLSWYDSLGI